ncbi:50S ribosomal protein L11 methyltransferase [Neolewinella antarctica]|uniref:Ribosomal protein L11 methyltransferase n=1 Tax=Neolewinella antarctica TaxID=442734 RepID=A0ABX0X5V9_9BACT|nr:50S ribosomal protein L11 methyltransferase [Neolewinella antarctica]NJC24593.1 ribosomal protein L11 methyltransferase [Neolewinella antarctica]
MYNQYSLNNAPELHPILVALLGEAGFDSFQETDAGLLAFGTTARHGDWTATLATLKKQFGFTYEWETLPEKNWNEEWESQFPPLYVGDRLFIRADFHAPDPEVPTELIITPKMAFGTGHHATTYMMCELMFDLPLKEGRVLDYGCGTGVLAILAKKLFADVVDAVDIEAPSVENTVENAARNGVKLDAVILGELKDVPAGPPYDFILANINRNVILATAGALYERLADAGTIVFSGILARDEQLLVERLKRTGFQHQQTRQREDWRAFEFTKA